MLNEWLSLQLLRPRNSVYGSSGEPSERTAVGVTCCSVLREERCLSRDQLKGKANCWKGLNAECAADAAGTVVELLTFFPLQAKDVNEIFNCT